jgi:hypothetical protein
VTDAARGQAATMPEEVRVAVQTLSADPPDYGRQKPAAERLPRLKATAAPPVPALFKVLGHRPSVSRFLSALSE